MDYFKRKGDEYTAQLNPIGNYMDQAITFASKYAGTSREEAAKTVKKLISKRPPEDPVVTFHERGENGDRALNKTKLTHYIKDVLRDKGILVPSFTVYDNPVKNKSLHAEFLGINIARRAKHKELSFEAYQNNDKDGEAYHTVLQKVMKNFNNSLSGVYASKSTSLYNPSQHYTLTSITRSVASIGNSVTESFIAGNKCLYTPDAAINYITAIISTVSMSRVAAAMKQYKLRYPTVDDVAQMLWHSSDRYWDNKEKKASIVKYLSTLDENQLAAVMYVNDLYHMRKLNEGIIRDFIGNMAKRVEVGCAEPLKALQRNVEGINNLAHHICMEDIKGMKVKYKELGNDNPELLMTLGSTVDNIYRVLDKYRLLIKAFFVTDILPIDIANIKDSYRDVIVLSDTDSTCGSYDNWTMWYFGYNRFTPEAVALSAAVMTINTQIIDHNIKVFAKNMNIENELTDLLKMKNEFFWTAFVTANVSKHYYANTWIQEGNVYAKPKLELKGVHLIASAGNQDIVSKAHKFMEDVLKRIESGEKIDVKELIKTVADTEREILAAIDKGDPAIFKFDKIKSKAAYKADDVSKTPYFHHLLWKEVFEEKYGDPGEPVYMTVKIPTILKSAKSLNDYVASIEDEDIKNKLSRTLKKYGKNALGTYRTPLSVTGGNGIPKEILQAIDKQRVVLDNMNIFYIQLETLGVYRKPNLLFSEMGY